MFAGARIGPPSVPPKLWTEKTILLVDDELRNLDLLETQLESLACRVVRATSGTHALDCYERHCPDLVLLDLMMPGIDGFDVLARLRENRGARCVPVMVVTAAGERDARLRAFDLGAAEFLDKPIDRSILLRRVHTLLELQDTADTLRRRNLELETLQARQSELTAFLVHDLKSPLASIRNNAEWLLEVLELDDETNAALEDVSIAAKRLSAMVNEILIVSRLEVGDELPIVRARFLPAEMALALIRENAKLANARGVTLTADVPNQLELYADARLVQRVLSNLLENAIRHTGPGGRISITARRDDDRTCVTVANTGSPIPRAERGRIFQKFERAGNGCLASMGLGLYFCRRVAEVHGGGIDVDSSGEWPVQFTFHVPNMASAA